MKFLHLATLASAADQVQDLVEGDTTSLVVKLEAYSSKKAGGDKKFCNALESQVVAEIQHKEQQLQQQQLQQQQQQQQQPLLQQPPQPLPIRSLTIDSETSRQQSISWGGRDISSSHNPASHYNQRGYNNSWSGSSHLNNQYLQPNPNLLSASWGSTAPPHHHEKQSNQGNTQQPSNPLSGSWGNQGPQPHSLSSSWGNGGNTPPGASPFGPMSVKSSRATLIDLICTLNCVFPDYDFSELRGDHFCKEDTSSVITNINTRLSNYDQSFVSLQKGLWQAIDEAIDLKECVVYSFYPDMRSSNPFEEDGTIWSFNYFFHNKKSLKRMLLFSCSAQLKDRDNNKTEENDFIEEEIFATPSSPTRTLGAGGRREWLNKQGDFEMDLMMEFEDF